MEMKARVKALMGGGAAVGFAAVAASGVSIEEAAASHCWSLLTTLVEDEAVIPEMFSARRYADSVSCENVPAVSANEHGFLVFSKTQKLRVAVPAAKNLRHATLAVQIWDKDLIKHQEAALAATQGRWSAEWDPEMRLCKLLGAKESDPVEMYDAFVIYQLDHFRQKSPAAKRASILNETYASVNRGIAIGLSLSLGSSKRSCVDVVKVCMETNPGSITLSTGLMQLASLQSQRYQGSPKKYLALDVLENYRQGLRNAPDAVGVLAVCMRSSLFCASLEGLNNACEAAEVRGLFERHRDALHVQVLPHVLLPSFNPSRPQEWAADWETILQRVKLWRTNFLPCAIANALLKAPETLVGSAWGPALAECMFLRMIRADLYVESSAHPNSPPRFIQSAPYGSQTQAVPRTLAVPRTQAVPAGSFQGQGIHQTRHSMPNGRPILGASQSVPYCTPPPQLGSRPGQAGSYPVQPLVQPLTVLQQSQPNTSWGPSSFYNQTTNLR